SVLLTATEVVDAARLQQAVEAVVSHHEALRLRFTQADGLWRQEVAPFDAGAYFERVDLGAEGAAAALRKAADEAQRGLTLERPFKALWFQMGKGRAGKLLLVAHHLVVDGVSWRILLEDLQAVYRQLRDGKAPELAPVATAWRDWKAALSRHARTLIPELPYWRALVDRDEPSLPGRAGAPNREGEARTVSLTLDEDRTEQLLVDVPQAYRTQINDILLTALSRALCEWAGRDSVLVELEGHGREDVGEALDVSRTVGWFTTLYPVRLAPGGADLGESIKSVKEQLRGVPGKGLGYGLLRHLTPEGAGLGNGTYPQVTFNYLGQFDQALDTDSGWRLARESAGQERAADSRRRTWLTVNAAMLRGALEIGFTYSPAIHDEDTIAALSQRFLDILEALIDLCAEGASGVTPSDFPLAAMTQEKLDGLGVPAANIEDIYPLAPMQQGLLLHTLVNPGSGMYLMQDRYRFDSEVDVAAFEKAWQRVVQRYEILRTGFVWRSEEAPLQVVRREAPQVVAYEDWSDQDADTQEARLRQTLRDELVDGFPMDEPALMRVRLIRIAANSYYVVQSFHHILMDAWCRSLLLRDFFAYYEAARGGPPANLATPRPYRDFIAWLQGQDEEKSRQYWRETLQGFDTATLLPYMKRRAGAADVASVGDAFSVLPAETVAALQSYAQRQQVTVNTITQAAWAVLLSRLSQASEVLFGVTVAGRPHELAGIQETVGLFINTIPLRVRLPLPDTPVASWLQALMTQNLEIRQHEHLPLMDIQSLSEVPRGRSLFDSIFVFENAPVDDSLASKAVGFAIAAEGGRTHTNYPLTMVVVPGRSMTLQLSYDAWLFDADDAQRLLDGFRQVLLQIIAGPDTRLHRLDPLLEPDRRQLLALCHGDAAAYPYDGGYAALFDAQVQRHGSRIAARSQGKGLRYAELGRLTTRLGVALREQGVRQGEVVALYADRGLDLLTLVVGTFKAGAAYLALDRRHPQQRLAAMLAASGASVVVGPAATVADLEGVLSVMEKPPTLLVYEHLVASARTDQAPPAASRPDQAAYVIYTSGSTGEPKGVVVTQQGMLNNQLSKIPYLGLGPDDVIAQTAAVSFDVSVWQMLAGLLCGACVEIVPDEVARDPGALLA
ncbi:condensation domain-containing protein, partial [Achromobacter sp. Root83]|uniref:condensation domain-containing protein n=1 Tax=Achromobacter sp. Root83 TaxID=1736602 RepID=UPI0012E3CEEE